MNALSRINPRLAIIAVAAILLAATFFLVRQPDDSKKVTAHFPRAVSVYEGTDVRVLGVNVGRVTAVIPEGNSVRVEMEYDADVDLPPDAKAVVVTPTLVADRFVQLTPVYTSGPKLADGADIALPDTGVPVELDRIYASIRDLAEALGPNGVNKDGSLNHLLEAGATALDGQGERGNEMIRQLSAAAATFGQGAGPLFDTVEELAQFTNTLATNDKLVRAFVKDLAGVSGSLVSERAEIQRALAAVADSVGTVKTFVQTNREALVTDVEKLTKLMKTINSERDSIDTALDVAPVAINNLTLAYNQESGTIGSRIGVQGQLWDADGFLCAIVQQSQMPKVSKDLACSIFKQLLEPVENNIPAIPSGKQAGKVDDAATTGSSDTSATGSTDLANRTQLRYATDDSPSLSGLLGGWLVTRPWKLLALLVAAVLLMSSCKFDGAYDLPLPGGPVDADNAIKVTAEFEDILNIVPKSPVMVDDVTVGEVTDVERVGWHAKITMLVRKDVELPDNAIAEIRQVSLLGEKYVALEPPPEGASTDRLGDGDNIPLAATGRNPEVEEVLGALSFLLSGGGVAQLGIITQELNKAMDGRQENLRHLLTSLTDVVGTLDDQKGDIIRALESVNNLTDTLNREKQTVTGALDVAGPGIKVLADQHDELIAMLSALDRLGVVGTRVISASKDDLLKSLADLKPVLSRLHQAGDKLAPGLNLIISFPFPKEASEIVRGDYANTSIRADINLDNFLPAGTTIPPIDIPDIPLPDLPPVGTVVSDVQKCLQSLDLTSKACQKVLGDVDLLTSLKKKCQKDKYRSNPVCTVLNTLPDLPIDQLGDALGDLLGNLLGRSLGTSLSSGAPTSRPSTRSFYGGTS